ncbi:MAG: hypothetical protein ACYC96_12925 [Fimbriimonadaceae bacterium]
MGYFVVHPGGQQYGPADVATLNQWAAEGRLIPDTALIDAATGAHVFARDVPGLFFPMSPPQSVSPGLGAPTVMPGPGVGTPLGGYRTPQPLRPPFGSSFPTQTPLSGFGGGGMAPAITASYIASIVGMVLACCVLYLAVLAGIVAIALGASAASIDRGRARGAVWLGIGTTLLGVVLSGAFAILGRLISGG